MDIREVHARHAIEMRERIAAIAGPRTLSKHALLPAAPLCMQLSRAPQSLEERNARIAEAAYFIAMHRGFSPGHELEDWLTAKKAVDGRLIGAPREF